MSLSHGHAIQSPITQEDIEDKLSLPLELHNENLNQFDGLCNAFAFWMFLCFVFGLEKENIARMQSIANTDDKTIENDDQCYLYYQKEYSRLTESAVPALNLIAS